MFKGFTEIYLLDTFKLKLLDNHFNVFLCNSNKKLNTRFKFNFRIV